MPALSFSDLVPKVLVPGSNSNVLGGNTSTYESKGGSRKKRSSKKRSGKKGGSRKRRRTRSKK